MSDVKKVRARKLNKNSSFWDKIDENFENVSNITKKDDNTKKVTRKRTKPRKIRMSFTAKEEKIMDKQMEVEDNLSVAVMAIILVLCFVVGISLGYILYKIAIDSSPMFIVRHLFG